MCMYVVMQWPSDAGSILAASIPRQYIVIYMYKRSLCEARNYAHENGRCFDVS